MHIPVSELVSCAFFYNPYKNTMPLLILLGLQSVHNIDIHFTAASSGHGMSRLSSLVISVLSEARRPAEVTTLRKLLTENTTRSHAEFFLRYTVVNHLVLQLQSPNSARVFGNVCPCLVESSSQFLQKMDTQVPVTKQRYSCPAFSNFGITL